MNYLYAIPENYYIYHHGILGQKWGIRRFQPYGQGYSGSKGKEVGEAAKIKQKNVNSGNSITPERRKELQDMAVRDSYNRAVKQYEESRMTRTQKIKQAIKNIDKKDLAIKAGGIALSVALPRLAPFIRLGSISLSGMKSSKVGEFATARNIGNSFKGIGREYIANLVYDGKFPDWFLDIYTL